MQNLLRVGSSVRVAFPLAILVALIGLQQFGHVAGSDLLGRTINNWLHVPLFAVVTLLLASLMPRAPSWKLLAATAGLAALSEILQIPTSRDASISDFLLDLAGATPVAFALWWQRTRGRSLVVLLSIAGLLVVLTSAAPARILAAYSARDHAFPILFDPDQALLGPLWSSNSATELIPAPMSAGLGSNRALELVWGDLQYPGVELIELAAGWQQYETLVVEVFAPEGSAMPLTAALQYDNLPGTVAFVQLHAEAGQNTLRYPLSDLQVRRNGSPARLILHTGRGQAGRRILLGHVYLLGRYRARPESVPPLSRIRRAMGFG